ncbi:MAG: hypothetical protein ACREFO_21040 [Acetobacteraceae bacterium]
MRLVIAGSASAETQYAGKDRTMLHQSEGIVEKLVEKLASFVHQGRRANFVLFGSAAITLHGVNLGRAIDDLDVFVSDQTFAKLHVCFDEQQKEGNDGPVPFFCPIPKIEILKSFPGVSFDEVHPDAKQTKKSCGFPIGTIHDLRRWKASQGREKDKADLTKIDDYFRTLS